ncbi:hypothetical protein BJY00DRAFT_320088 [Aspergillus carlsbadensis]|nr:hypothetical protein BJY00DRAFT_320088 [Aspergillus carlsbadensis]
MDTLPELVNDYKWTVRVFEGYVSHQVPNLTKDGPARRRTREERWKRDGFLGSGGFGRVWREKCLEDSQPNRFRAVKSVPKQSHASCTIDYSRELEAMIKFSREKYTPSFVTMFGWYEDPGSIYIAMEYFIHGDLQQHLAHPLPETDARQITQQVLEALEHLHANGFAHRDLKPANVFVVEKAPEWWVKIGDFGVSKRAKDPDTGFSSIAGTPGYQAPEVQSLGRVGQEKYTHLVDIWSLGVMAHYMLTRAFPFEASHQWIAYRESGAFPLNALAARSVSLDSHDFIRCVMALEPSSRPSASDALQHAWLKMTLRDTPQPSHNADESDMVPEIEGEVARLTLASPCASSRSWTEFNETLDTPPKRAIPGHSAQMRGMQLFQEHRFAEAEAEFQRAYTTRKDLCGPTDIRTLHSLRYVGRCLYHQGKLQEAGRLCLQVAEDAKQVLGLSDQYTLDCLYALGHVLYAQKKYNEAHQTYRAVYERAKENSDISQKRRMTLAHRMGCCLLFQGHYNDAEVAFRGAYDGRNEALGPTHTDTLDSLVQLGSALATQGKYRDAEACFRDAHKGLSITLGPTHDSSIWALRSLAKCIFNQDRYAEAQGHYASVLEGRRSRLGPGHESTISVLGAVGKCLVRQEKFGEAEEPLQEVYNWHKEHSGPAHQETLSFAYELGHCRFRTGNHAEAEGLLQEAFDGRRDNLGPTNEDTLVAADVLARCFASLGKWENEASVCEFLHGVEKELHGPFSSNALFMLRYHARALFKQGYQGSSLVDQQLLDKAAVLFEECYEGFQVLYGDDHRDTVSTLARLAHCKEGAESIDLWTRVTAGYTKLSGPKHEDALTAAFHLAQSHMRMNDWSHARRLFQSTYAGFREISGPHGQKTLESLESVGYCCYHLENYYAAHDAFQELHRRFAERDGPLHKHALGSLCWVARCLQTQAIMIEGQGESQATKRRRKHTEAKGIYSQVYEARKEALGVLHEDTVDVRSRLRWYEDNDDLLRD